MNQDYLWSKSGSDTEVERLESLLAEFHFDENSVPELPAPNALPVGSTRKRRFVLGLSFAAITAALVMAAIWIIRVPNPIVATNGQDPGPVPEIAQPINEDRTHYTVAEHDKDLVSMAEPRILSRPKMDYVRSKVNRTVPSAKPEKAKFTKEEKYAYDRLMLALSIAGSKLKVVQDTIDRNGDAPPRSVRNEK